MSTAAEAPSGPPGPPGPPGSRCCENHQKCRAVAGAGPKKEFAPDDPDYIDSFVQGARAGFCFRYGVGGPCVESKEGGILVDYSTVGKMELPAYRALLFRTNAAFGLGIGLGDASALYSTAKQVEDAIRAALPSIATKAQNDDQKKKKEFARQLQTQPFRLLAFQALLSCFKMSSKFITTNIETSQKLTHTRDLRPRKGTFQIVPKNKDSLLVEICNPDHFCLGVFAALKLLIWRVQEGIGFHASKQSYTMEQFRDARKKLQAFSMPGMQETAAQWWARCLSLSFPAGIKVLAAGGFIPENTGKANPVIIRPDEADKGVRRLHQIILDFFENDAGPAEQQHVGAAADVAASAACVSHSSLPLSTTQERQSVTKGPDEEYASAEGGMSGQFPVNPSDSKLSWGSSQVSFPSLRMGSSELRQFGLDKESFSVSSGRCARDHDASSDEIMMGAPGPAVRLMPAPRASDVTFRDLVSPTPLLEPDVSLGSQHVGARGDSQASSSLPPKIEGVEWAYSPKARSPVRKRRKISSETSESTPKSKWTVLSDVSPNNSLGSDRIQIPFKLASQNIN